MIFAGYAPLSLPYSDEVIVSCCIRQDTTYRMNSIDKIFLSILYNLCVIFTDQILTKELHLRGFKSQEAVKSILSVTKRENILRYMNDLFKDVTSFGKNCFRVQIGRGDNALSEVAFVSVSLLGGDNEHLNYVCGTSSTCKGRNCRRCMSNRTYRFMLKRDECICES